MADDEESDDDIETGEAQPGAYAGASMPEGFAPWQPASNAAPALPQGFSPWQPTSSDKTLPEGFAPWQPDTDQQQQPEPESSLWTGLRAAAHSILPSAAGLAGIPGGIALGAAVGLPEAGIGAIPGAIIGGIGGYMVGRKAQETGLNALGFDDSHQQAVNAAAHPYAQTIGEIGGALPFFGVGEAPAAVRAAGAAFGGGMEAFNQYMGGEGFDPAQIALAAGGGGIMVKPTALGEALGSRTAAAIGRPDLWHGTAAPTSANDATAHPPPVEQAVGDPQNKPTRSETDYGKEGAPPAGQPPAEQPITNTDPALDAAIRAKMEPEGEPTAAPPGQEPAAPAIPATPSVAAEQQAQPLRPEPAAEPPPATQPQPVPANIPASRRVGDIYIEKDDAKPGWVVKRGADVISEHPNLGQAMVGLNRAVKQANLPLPPDEAFAPAPAAPAPAPVRTRPEVVVPAKAKGPRARDPETYSLLQYLAAKGGLKPSPELTTIFGGTNPFIPGFGRLIRKTGMHLDKAWEAAARSSQYINDPSDRAGGLAKTSINDLLDLIDKENRGAKQYQLGQEGTATASERDRAAETNRVAIGRAVDNFAEQSGYGEIEPKLYDRTVQIMEKEGVSDPDIAFERALMEDHERNEKDIRTRQETVGDIPGWDDAVPRAAREAGSSLRQAGLELEPAGRGAETTAGEGPRGPSEMGAEGRPQTVIPGAERISEAELAQRRADERLKPTAPQRPADEGLFGDTHLQEDLFTGGRNELLQQRVNAADIAPDPAAHLRETAAMYREQGQEGRARQLEQGANAIERSQQQQQQQQQQRQQPAAAGGGPPKPPTVGQAAAAGGGKLPPGPTSMAYAPPQNRSNLSKLWRSMKLLVGSDIGPYGRQAENIIRGAYGRAKRVFEQTMNLLNPHMETVRNMDPMDRAALMNRVEGGKDFPNWQPTPDQQRIIDVYKPAMDLWKDQFSKLDRTAQMKFVTDYLAHMYKNPAQASEFFSQFGKRGGAGSTKGRTHATYEDAKKAGLEPLTDNPIEIATRYGLSMTNFLASNDALERAVETGVVGYFSSGKSVGATGSPEPHQVGGPPPGWKKLNAPPKGPFLEAYAPEDFADKYNAFYSQGLRGAHAPIYDALRSANAGWTMMELGLNAYHFFTMANEAIISDVKRGLDQIFTGQIKEGAKTIAGAPLAPGTRYIEGKRFQREYLDPNSTNPIASIMAEANARPVGRGHAYDILGSTGDENISRGSFIKNFDKDKINSQLKQAWDDVKDDWGLADSVGKQAMFPFKQASRVLQTVGAPLFDKYIPALKAGAMHSQMADWLAANPHIDINTPAGRQAAVEVARKISDSVDNAFGEMVHDNLFMNQALRHAAMVAMRSFSWSIGAMRQIGGGTYAAGKAGVLSLKTGENRFSMAHPEFDPRISYAIAFPFVVATISAIYQGLRAGEAPQDWRDLYAPRTGGTVPGLGGKGQVPEHALMPGFQKDVYGWLSHPGREAYAKLGGLPTTAIEHITNRDWRGDPIAQRGASPIDQLQQHMAHLFSKLGPIGARAIAKGQPETSGITPVETALGFRAPGVDIQDPQRLEKWMAASAKKEWKAKERHDKTEQRKYARERTYDPQEREQQPQ